MKLTSLLLLFFIVICFACNGDDAPEDFQEMLEEELIDDDQQQQQQQQNGKRCQSELFTNVDHTYKIFIDDDAYLIPNEDEMYLGKLADISSSQLPINTTEFLVDLPDVDTISNTAYRYTQLSHNGEIFYITASTFGGDVIFEVNLEEANPIVTEFYRGFGIADIQYREGYLYFIEHTGTLNYVRRISTNDDQGNVEEIYEVPFTSSAITSLAITSNSLIYTDFYKNPTLFKIDLTTSDYSVSPLCCGNPLWDIQFDQSLNVFTATNPTDRGVGLAFFRFDGTLLEEIDYEALCFSGNTPIHQLHGGFVYNGAWRYSLQSFNL